MNHETLPYLLARAAQQKTLKTRRRQPATAAAWRLGADLLRSPTQKAGLKAEERACEHIQAQGLSVLARNLRGKTGEIDLIANDSGTLVFIEVRHRSSRQYGGAAASVNRHKQQRLIKTARFFLPLLTRRFFHGRLPPCRFDVISLEPDGLNWVRAAFEE